MQQGQDKDDSFEVPEFHRDEELDEEGVSVAVVEQFVHRRLPFLLKVKEEMDNGKVLSEGELELLTQIVGRAHNVNTLVYQHPELKELVAKMIDLVHDITGEALDNETGD
ncbi:MAG: hypothetical protein CME59_10765 [Halioglobus sp.]|nr:hypothetical protein [Halioglobus sp.]|tara:strand:- start:2827 stop:3156 length:330 start_codon:yes stop_codon:yes gene_type:complete